jgi:predicted PurR-regulated permease PerM
VTEKKYKLDTIRLINLWLLPAFFSTFITILFILKYERLSQIKTLDILVWALLFLFSVGMYILLFLNHFPFAKQTQLIFTENRIEITQGENNYKIDLKNINSVTEYSSNNKYTSSKLPWASLIKWKLKTENDEYIISSLTISETDFKKIFSNKIKFKFSFFPRIV